MTDKPHQIASAKFHAKRRDAGWKKVTVWLDSESASKLEILRTQEGSLDKAIAYAVRMSPTREVVESAEYEWADSAAKAMFGKGYEK